MAKIVANIVGLLCFTIYFAAHVIADAPDCETYSCATTGTTGHCVDGTFGNSYCQCKSGYHNVSGNTKLCEPDDPCEPNPCPTSDKYTGACISSDFWNHECACKGAYVHPSGDDTTCAVRDWCGETGGCSGAQYTGQCTNFETTKNCVCSVGYEHPDATTTALCVDKNECALGSDTCNKLISTCVNTEGSYDCMCAAGWKRGSTNKSCIDINECVEGIDQNLDRIPCDPESAECVNTTGGFSCGCYLGYVQADNYDVLLPDGCHGCCIDRDECATPSLNSCSDFCSNGLVSVPVATNYTCGCWGGRYPSDDYLCMECQYGSWGEWSDCDVECGIGSQLRQRTPLADGAGYASCSAADYTTETGSCEMPRCITCSTTAWSPWSACTSTCGGGSHDRSRVILDGTAASCPTTDTEETDSCNTQSCDPTSVDKMALIISSAVVGGFAIIGGAVVWKLRKRKGRRANQDDDDGGYGYSNNPYGNLAPNYDLYAPQYL